MKKSILMTLIAFGIVVILAGNNSEVANHDFSLINSIALTQKEKKDLLVKIVYSCPMHSEVVQEKAGKCLKCGMDLKAKEVRKDVYTCPMHSEVVQDKMGKCPKCGMKLALKTTAIRSGSSMK